MLHKNISCEDGENVGDFGPKFINKKLSASLLLKPSNVFFSQTMEKFSSLSTVDLTLFNLAAQVKHTYVSRNPL
jgi:hypothetical protein